MENAVHYHDKVMNANYSPSLIKREFQKQNKILKRIGEFYKKSKYLKYCTPLESIDLIFTNFFNLHEEILDRYRKGNHNGIKWITQVNSIKDIELVQLLIDKGIEVRHVKDLLTNTFALSDKSLLFTIENGDAGNFGNNTLINSDKLYIDHYNTVFESLWEKGIDVDKRIKEIQKGHHIYVDVMTSPRESVNLFYKLFNTAKKEVLMILSSVNAIDRIESNDDFSKCEELTSKGIKVKVLIPLNLGLDGKLNYLKQKYPNIDFRGFFTSFESFIGITVIDRLRVVLSEVKDDSKKDYYDSIGLTIFIEGKSSALSYTTIFNSLWKQTEICQQLESIDEYKNEFLSMLSHELKTPLVPIKGYTEMLLNTQLFGKLNEKQIKAIQSIYRNEGKIESMVQDMLYIYTKETQKINISRKDVKVIDILNNVTNDLKPLLEEKKIILETEIHENVENTIYCDQKRIEQVLSNLVKNSIDFVQKDNGKITISVKKTKENGDSFEKNGNDTVKDPASLNSYCEFTVTDNGPGIPEDKMDLLFKKFYQIDTSATRKYGGTGLGLAVCKDLIGMHGGKIWIDKNQSEGASIKFNIP
ncbi:MAG: sensor histidine kinase [Candidatus Nitrosocosmicus sp.]